MGKIIAVAVPKGGVGKTTTAVNLATSLAIAEKHILLVDVDPMGTCSQALGISDKDVKGGIFDVFNFSKSIEQVTHNTYIPNMKFIPSRLKAYLDEERLSKLAENKLLLRNILRSEIFNYDYIIIDCPPYLRGLTTSALLAADSVILPIRQEFYSLTAATKLFEHIEWIKQHGNSLLQIEGILLTMYESRTKVSTLAQGELLKQYSSQLFKTVIPQNTTLTEATFNGKPAVLFNATAKGSVAYLQLAEELMQRENHFYN